MSINRHSEVRPWLVTSSSWRIALAWCSRMSSVQARSDSSLVSMTWSSPHTWWTTVRPSLTSSVISIYVPPVVVSSWCRVTVSARSAVGPSQWLVRCPGTCYRTVSTSRHVMITFQTTVSNIHWKHFSLVDIDVPSAVEVFTTLRYINVHLLTYLLNSSKNLHKQRRCSYKWGTSRNAISKMLFASKFLCLIG